MYQKTQSSFHGKISEISGVYVDNFENAENKKVRAFFLSHYHSDHIQGLYSTELLDILQKSNAKIYTTELTSAIIDGEKKDERLMKYIRSLKTGSTTITLPAVPNMNFPELLLTVTLIPAGHCAGSTMFLFRTPSQNILFTGDFRINCNDLPKYTSLHDNGEPINLDCLYVDTTFINLEYENFPKRSESVEKMLFEIKEWLCTADSAVAIYTPAKYGYEFVFNEIYDKLQQKVYVDSAKWIIYSKIPHLVPGVTNDKNETQIHLCRNRRESFTHEKCIDNKYNRFLYVYLSAMKWRHCNDDFCSIERVSQSCINVCFATHCSRKELLYFVNYLSPKKVVGFPNKFSYSSRKRTVSLENEFESKKVKVDRKVDKKLLQSMFD